MKRFFVLFLALLSLAPVSFAAETVAQMAYVVEMPDVTREGLYTGELSNGIPNGYGVFTAVNSSGTPWHYIGQWVDGKMCGQGGQYWDSGYYSIGHFKDNNMTDGVTPTSTDIVFLEDDEVVVPLGIYKTGVDIPVGSYKVRMTSGMISTVELFDAEGNSLEYYSILQGKSIGKLELEEGQTVRINGNAVIFAPYKGLGFK